MIRQRISLRTPALAYVVRALTLVLALGLIWYGLMVVLLAVKVSPHTVNAISGYRSLYHDAATVTSSDFSTLARVIGGLVGLLAFFLLLYLALQELPRPYLARGSFPLSETDRGETTIAPRAVERVAEAAALADEDVASARGRLGDSELHVAVEVRRATGAAQALADVRRRVREQLEEHELPVLPVHVTLADYAPRTRRELS